MEQLTAKPEAAVRVGFLGLMYRSWIETSILSASDFKVEKVFSLGKEMSRMLKERFKCDLVVGISHMSNNEDMNLQNQHTNIDLSRALTAVLGGHEHVYMYRKFGNSVLVKSGDDFNTYSDIRVSFEESRNERVREIPAKKIFKISKYLKSVMKKQISENLESKSKSSSSEGSLDSETDSENQNPMADYKSSGQAQTSYDSELYFNDKQCSTKMTSFPAELYNEAHNQFNAKIRVHVRRVDIDHKQKQPALEAHPSYKALDEHVRQVMAKIEEKGREKLFYLMDEVDLTSHSVRTSENNMGNWVSRFIQIESGADVALCTGGSLRSMQKFPKDYVFTTMDLNCMASIFDPFEFVLAPMKVFVQILENSYRGLPNALGSFIHFAGANVTIDSQENYCEDEVLGRESDLFSKRIKDIRLDHKEFDPELPIVLVGPGFIVNGKDGFTAFNKAVKLGMKDFIIEKNEMLSRFFRLARDERVREEFAFFKGSIAPHVTDSVLREMQEKKDYHWIDRKTLRMNISSKRREANAQKEEWLTRELYEEAGLHEGFGLDKLERLVDKLQLRVLKRIRKYMIVHGIRQVEDAHIFEISPKFFNKIQIK